MGGVRREYEVEKRISFQRAWRKYGPRMCHIQVQKVYPKLFYFRGGPGKRSRKPLKSVYRNEHDLEPAGVIGGRVATGGGGSTTNVVSHLDYSGVNRENLGNARSNPSSSITPAMLSFRRPHSAAVVTVTVRLACCGNLLSKALSPVLSPNVAVVPVRPISRDRPIAVILSLHSSA